MTILALLCAMGMGLAALPAAAQTPAAQTPAAQTPEERLAELEREVEQLREQLAARDDDAADDAAETGAAGERLAEIERRLEILAEELERMSIGEAAAQADQGQYGFGPAASKIYRTERGLSFGGYGEMLYQGFDASRDDGAPSGKKDELDFLRAVLYVGYKFNDRWLLNTELEFEHASTDTGGSASVEFAYIDYLHGDKLNARFGLLLVPMGMVNELHEPTVFLGARRPDVERVIIPSTWRENGLGLFGDLGDFSYRAYVVNGLDASGFSAGGLRGGRQKGGRAVAEDFAFVGRVDYTGTPGLLLGASLYVGDSGQGLIDSTGRAVGVSTTIYEAHFEWGWRGFEIGGLYAHGSLGDVTRLNDALGLSGRASVGEELEGAYLQLAYDVLARRGGDAALFPYVRWESYDTQARVPGGFRRDPARDVESLTVGLAYQPLDRLIFKLDYQDYDNGAGTGIDQFNVALGYVF